MATGIALPLRAVNGRLMLLSGDGYIEQLVKTAMGSSESSNPFQDVGLGEFMIFDINDALTEGVIRQRVVRVFASLERDQLARLVSLAFEGIGSEKVMQVVYDNLETGYRSEVDVPLSEWEGL